MKNFLAVLLVGLLLIAAGSCGRVVNTGPQAALSGMVYFSDSTIPMTNGPNVYFADTSDPLTVIGSTTASALDGSYTLDKVDIGDYYVGVLGEDGWASTFEAVNVPNLNSNITLDINLHPESFEVLRTGSETLNAVTSYGATRYVVGAGSPVILRSSDDITWTNLPLDGTFTNDPLIWVNSVATTVGVITGTGHFFSSTTPEASAAWTLDSSASSYLQDDIVDYMFYGYYYLVTSSGRLLRTAGGNPPVFTDITPTGQHINAVEIARPVSTYEVLVCGDNGYVAQIDYNGSLVLDLRGDLGSNENLRAAASTYGNDPVMVYSVVAESGSVFKTEDSGSTWQTVLANAPCEFNDVWMNYGVLPGQDFRDLGMYVVGSNGLIMRKR